MKQVKLWTILAWYLYLFVQNWKCRTSTKGTKVPPGHPPLPLSLYHPPVRNEKLRLSFLLAHGAANGEERSLSYLVLAHLLVPCWRCAHPPFQLRTHCWSLQVLRVFFPLITGICRQFSALFGLDGSPPFVKYTCPSLCVVPFLLAPCSQVRAACKSA